MIKNIKPALVLTLVITIVSVLLMVTYNMTYVDNSGVITEELREKCVALMGEGEYSIVTDWLSEGYSIEKPDKVEKLVKKDDGSIAFEIISNGYNKKGLDIVVAMNDDGTVKGVSIISMTETPGVGTKVDTPEFLDIFNGIGSSVKVVKGNAAAENEVSAITGATYSSKGVASAVNTAIETYKEMGAIK